LVLIAPDWKGYGTARTVKQAVTILHSEHDEVIPLFSSEELVALSGLPKERLLVVGANHSMADDEALAALLWAVQSCSNDH
jgi:fermentation-respiration switch protein FrsA (DUF1100 family)